MLKTTLKLLVTGLLLGIIVWQLDGVAGIASALSRVNPYLAALLMIVITADRAIMTVKWIWLLRARAMTLRFFEGLRIYCVASFWGQILPMTLGADVVRVFMTTRSRQGVNTVVATIVIERMVGFLASLLMGLTGLLVLSQVVDLDPRFEQVWWISLGLVSMALLLFLASFSQVLFDVGYTLVPSFLARTRIVGRIREMHETYLAYRQHGDVLSRFSLLTFLEQLVPIVYIWIAAKALGVELDYLVAFGIVPVATLVTRIPVSVAGIGVLEGAFMLLMPLGGVAPADAVAIALLDRIIQLLATLPWWIAEVIRKGRVERPRPPLIEEVQS